MDGDSQDRKLTPFAAAVYAFLRSHIDDIDIKHMSGADFATLLDLKKTVDEAVARGKEKWRSGGMS